jgi:hypothetical protein
MLQAGSKSELDDSPEAEMHQVMEAFAGWH